MPLAYPIAAVLAASVVMVAIRAPYGHRSMKVKVAKSRKGRLETALLTMAWLGFFVPILWMVTPIFTFADYPLHPAAFGAGVACFIAGLWLFHRSHQDLGTNWSITLEVRENHQLITRGVYRRIRHPMYSSLLLYSVGQALALPNWVAGPSYLVALGLLFALRVIPEERMMREQFGAEYDAYASRTKRLIPGIW
jgi:protein-S-isoprenylcysteine O-methyltransferase Ste14